VTIDITGPDDFADSTVTDENGEFGFTLVDAGEYTLTETNPEDYASSTPDVVVVSFDGSTPVTDVDFGDYPAGSITGTVFNDLNRDRALDEGDAPLEGVTVTLNSGTDMETQTLSLSDGTYTFPDLALGTYTVVETDPTGYFSTTPNEVEADLLAAGDAVSVNFGDFLPEEGEVSDHELLLWDYFDVLMIDVLHLRDDLGWGFGNIARALFLSDLYDIPLEEILEMREDDMMGWGKILRSLTGFASLKGYNWGLIVSGRGEPNGNFNNGLMKKAEACGFEGEGALQDYSTLLAEHGHGLVNRACRLRAKFGGDFSLEFIMEKLQAGWKMKDFKQELLDLPDSLEPPDGGEEDEGNGNGPPPCKGWRKDDPGC
jgi:hypothetical protein